MQLAWSYGLVSGFATARARGEGYVCVWVGGYRARRRLPRPSWFYVDGTNCDTAGSTSIVLKLVQDYLQVDTTAFFSARLTTKEQGASLLGKGTGHKFLCASTVPPCFS